MSVKNIQKNTFNLHVITIGFHKFVCYNSFIYLFIYFHCIIMMTNFLCFHRKLSCDKHFGYLSPEGLYRRHAIQMSCEHQMAHNSRCRMHQKHRARLTQL